MKKLFTPILVLTLIVGFSALALGATTKASADQTLTVDVATAYSISAPSDIDTGITVGPDTTDSLSTLSLEYKLNDTDVSSIDVDVTGFLSGLELTFTDSSSNTTGDANTFTVSSSTHGGTLLSGNFSAGDYTSSGNGPESFDITFSKVNWDEPAGDNKTLTATYKIMV